MQGVNGRTDPRIVELENTLRLIVIIKPGKKAGQKGWLRPVGIPSARRRIIFRLIAVAFGDKWAHFFSHMLPADALERAAVIREADEALQQAKAAEAATAANPHSTDDDKQAAKRVTGEAQERSTEAVSYTHLTLPTICSV